MKKKHITILKNKWFWLDQLNDVFIVLAIIICANSTIPKVISIPMLGLSFIMFIFITYKRRKDEPDSFKIWR